VEAEIKANCVLCMVGIDSRERPAPGEESSKKITQFSFRGEWRMTLSDYAW
jgi:hypothetical protein